MLCLFMHSAAKFKYGIEPVSAATGGSGGELSYTYAVESQSWYYAPEVAAFVYRHFGKYWTRSCYHLLIFGS